VKSEDTKPGVSQSKSKVVDKDPQDCQFNFLIQIVIMNRLGFFILSENLTKKTTTEIKRQAESINAQN
jgi:hypothetical protein